MSVKVTTYRVLSRGHEMIYHDAERIWGNSRLLLLVILSALSAIYSALFQLYDARTKLDGTRNVLIGQIL